MDAEIKGWWTQVAKFVPKSAAPKQETTPPEATASRTGGLQKWLAGVLRHPIVAPLVVVGALALIGVPRNVHSGAEPSLVEHLFDILENSRTSAPRLEAAARQRVTAWILWGTVSRNWCGPTPSLGPSGPSPRPVGYCSGAGRHDSDPGCLSDHGFASARLGGA